MDFSQNKLEQLSSEPIIGNTPVQDNTHRKKVYIVILTFLVFFAVLFVGYSYYFLSNNSKNKIDFIPSPTPIPTAVVSNGDIPALFSGVSWKESSKDKTTLGEYAIYSQKEPYGPVSMSGKEWEAKVGDLSEEQMNKLLKDFGSYYSSEMARRGWTTSYKDTRVNLSAAAADGPGGSIYGYIKSDGKTIRTIVFHEEIPIEAPGDMGLFNCPCKVILGVFVSDVIPLENLLK